MSDCFNATVSYPKYGATVSSECINNDPLVQFLGGAPADVVAEILVPITPIDMSIYFSSDVEAFRFQGLFPDGILIDPETGIISGAATATGEFDIRVEARNNRIPWVEADEFNFKAEDNAFITVWETITADESISLQLDSATTYNFLVDWGDGSSDTIIAYNQAETTHMYEVAGEHTVRITGSMPVFRQLWETELTHLKKIIQLGAVGWTYLSGLTYDCPSLVSVNTAPCDVSGVEYIYYMIYGVGANLKDVNISGLNSPLVTYATNIVASNTGLETLISNDLVFPSLGSASDMFEYNGKLISFSASNWTIPQGISAKDFIKFAEELSVFDGSLFENNAFSNYEDVFHGNAKLDTDISLFDISLMTAAIRMMEGTAFSNENYDKMLIAWAAAPHQNNVTFGAGLAEYSDVAVAARDVLIADGWTFIDNGHVDHFKFTISVLAAGTFTLPLVSGRAYNFLVEWGDGLSDTITAYDQTEILHTYGSLGSYKIAISGLMEEWSFQYGEGDALKVTSVESFGSVGIKRIDIMWGGCDSMITLNIGKGDLSSLDEDFYYMCYGCNSLVEATISGANVSSVTRFIDNFQYLASLVTLNMENLHFTDSIAEYEYIRHANTCPELVTINNSNITLDADFPLFNYKWVGWCPKLENVGLGVLETIPNESLAVAFADCALLDPDLSNADISQLKYCSDMMLNSGFSDANYDKLLLAWSARAHQNDVEFHAGNAQFTELDAKQALIDDGWDITDGGSPLGEPPVLLSVLPNMTAYVGVFFSYDASIHFEAGDGVNIYSKAGGATWMTVDATTGVLSGTPSGAQGSSCWIYLRSVFGEAADSFSVQTYA